MLHQVSFEVNGEHYTALAESRTTLNYLLREKLGFTAAKESCSGMGECGSCSVIMNGKVVNSCLVLAVEANGKEVLTLEGLAKDKETAHPLQKAFVDHGALQCGYCTSGMIMTSKALLDENPDPTEEEIKVALAGNVCRCTGYARIVEAVKAAAKEMKING
jgi:carbon-monoxide dehydrogenase small subunit